MNLVCLKFPKWLILLTTHDDEVKIKVKSNGLILVLSSFLVSNVEVPN